MSHNVSLVKMVDSPKIFEKSEEKHLTNFIEKADEKEQSEFSTGRWELDEHKKFVEAIIEHGNDWKLVQKHIGSRSSAQARSHAQKFFLKLKRSNVLEMHFDFEKNSIKSLKDLITKMNKDEYLKAVKAIKSLVFDDKKDKKAMCMRRIKKNNM